MLHLIKRCATGTSLFAITMALLLPSLSLAQYNEREKTIESLKKTIGTDKENLEALRSYIAIMGFPNETVVADFNTWMKEAPQSVAVPYALGEAYYKQRDRKSITYLIKARQAGQKDERVSKMISIAARDNWDLDIARTPNTIDSLKKIIAANPDSSLPLRQYVFLLGNDNDTVINQFTAWTKQFPQSTAIPYALGENYYEEESPKAKPWLLKVVEMQPTNAKVWQMLSIDAERWGNEKQAHEYMGKAAAADPNDPSYSFYYAMDFEHIDKAKWRSALYALAKRFPNHERGAQGLYWLATRSTDQAEKVKVYEELRTLYPPLKFSWSSGGMSSLYDCYLLNNETAKAKELAQAMIPKDEQGKAAGAGEWPAKVALAENVEKVRSLVAAKKIPEAMQLLDKLKAGRYSAFANEVALLKSSVIHESGNTQGAYDSLIVLEAKTPSDNVKAALVNYGSSLGKNTEQVENDTWTAREKSITKATDFSLGLYTSNKKVSLADFKGKVMLMTFWFPGCGPCRGEFPHFENVLKKFKGKDIVYVGINVFPEQDDYVLPFMQGTKYTFIPLRGTADWAEKAYKVRGEPTNFLIDEDGRIVFSNFMINGNNERMLELMIASMLNKKDLAKK
jgi:thiol-disulfide isomerase/thioredoxin/tetratricopeptide (TPR) repeat protein